MSVIPPEQTLKYMNEARTNPAKFAEYVKNELAKFINPSTLPLYPGCNYSTNEGNGAWKEAIAFLTKQPPLPPFILNEGLTLAAQDHAIDMAKTGIFGHNSSNGASFSDRINKRCGQSYGSSGQNIGSEFKVEGRNHALQTVKGLIIDDGVSSRGHRKNIFSKDFKYVGISSRVQNDKIITVIDFHSEKLALKNGTQNNSNVGNNLQYQQKGGYLIFNLVNKSQEIKEVLDLVVKAKVVISLLCKAVIGEIMTMTIGVIMTDGEQNKVLGIKYHLTLEKKELFPNQLVLKLKHQTVSRKQSKQPRQNIQMELKRNKQRKPQLIDQIQNQTNIYQYNKIMSETQALRATIMQETDGLGQKRRFGLFSAPISTAIGDDGPYKTKLHPRNEQGKPQTDLRGIFTNPPRSGQLNKSHFAPINSLAAGEVKDQYIDPDRKLLLIENQNFKKGFSKEQMFIPASGFKQLYIPPYQYKEENPPEKDPKRNRQQDGKVKAQPRNFYSNQQSTVIRSFFKPIKYMEDPYERAHQTQVDFAKKQKSLQAQASFKLNLHPKDTFDKSKKVFGTDVEFPEKKIKNPKFNILKHETRWKSNNPNRSGLYGYFTPFPFYKQDPPKQLTRKPKQSNKRQSFRRMSVSHSKPSPTIAYNRNLIRTISHSFSLKR